MKKLLLLTFVFILSSVNTYPQWTNQNSGTDKRIMGLHFLNENLGWACGNEGTILKTTNGGAEWISQSISTLDNVHAIFFIDSLTGWAVLYEFSPSRHASIIHTTNSGEIWEEQLNINGYTLASVHFTDEMNGWVAGSNGIVFHTTNGGTNWIQQYPPTQGGWLWPIFFIDNNIGWTTGDPQFGIFKSTDGGNSWQSYSIPVIERIYSMIFLDYLTGWVSAAQGQIAKSVDGGITWENMLSGTSEYLEDIFFIDYSNGWCVGDNGTILNTTNGGSDWTTQTSNTFEDLRAVQFINNNVGWTVGTNGVILKYSNEPPPLWSNQVIVEDAGGIESSEVLTFGQHTDATDSIDASLGEYELPPPPFPGIFDARFNLPTNPLVSSPIDFRDSTLTDIIWNMSFQPSSAGYPMTFSWDSTSFPEGTFYLKDRIDGSYVFVNMKNQSSYVLTNPVITSLNINYKGNCSMVSINNEWNMLSVPLLAEDMSLSNLFPTATSSAYGYEGGYVEEDTLVEGVGYWLKFGGSENIQICGVLLEDTVQVKAGWNMIGPYEEDIPVIQLTTTPPGIIATYFFGFEDGYYIADTLKSGKGYWVRVTEDGVINLNGGALSKEDNLQIAQIDEDWGKIQITDSGGKRITLYATDEEMESDLYELPPMPPSGILDARYGSGKFVEALTSEKIIQISSDKYPITIGAEGLNITVRDRINGDLLNKELNNGEEIRIINNKITSIEVIGEITGGLPVSYELYQNYPNPFNPSTTIKFAVPKESSVNLSIYNVLGELVSTVVNEQLKAGYYEYEFNASNFASGVYLYSITAGSFVATKKMVLMK